MPDTTSSFWAHTNPTLDGVYRATVEIGEDVARVLTPTQAQAYAHVFIESAVRATYDAAVYAQMRDLGLDHNSAGLCVMDLREERPELDMGPVKPLRLEPGVNAKGQPFIGIHLAGRDGKEEPYAQVDIRQAKHHAMSVLEVSIAADFDSAYLRFLKGMDIPDEKARAAVGALAEHQADTDQYGGAPEDGQAHD